MTGTLWSSTVRHVVWRPALVAVGIIAPGVGAAPAGVTTPRPAGVVMGPPVADGTGVGGGNGMHALRHLAASVLLDAGESIKALSEYLGHADPGFTLRTYTHLMPASAARSRGAIDHLFSIEETESDGPTTARRTS